MRYALLVFVLFLVGCPATIPVDQKPQDPIFVGTKVNVGVKEKCHVKVPEEPIWTVETVAKDAPAFDKSKAILAELEQRRDYISLFKAAAKDCE